jgi:EAL domain-containing protein (putative c-di-GMP-specific phosphodiesterase class I)
MQTREKLLSTATGFCAFAAFGCSMLLFADIFSPKTCAVIGLAALAFGQLILLAKSFVQAQEQFSAHHKLASDVLHISRGSVEIKRNSEYMLSQMAELRSEAAASSAAVAAGFADLKYSYTTLTTDMQALITVKRDYEIPEPVAQPVASAALIEEAEPEVSSPFGDELLLSLEPIIDLHTGNTAHYRMHVGMTTQAGAELSHDKLMHHADNIGVRAQLDMFIAREAALLLRRLRKRDPSLNIFVSIGAATLSNHKTLMQMIADRQEAADIAQGLVYEMPHAMLAGLSEKALEGLAILARQGAVLALSNVSLAGLDLHAMSTLNVRFVGLDVGAIDAAAGPSTAMIGFAQAARATGIQLMVTGVATSRIVASLPQITRFAAGPCFAEPRRVKREVAAINFGVAA